MHLNQARQALALAKSIPEVKDIRDKAEALRAYAKQAGMGLEVQNECAEVKIRAERKAGKMLAEQIPHAGGRPKPLDKQRVFLKDLGISWFQSHRWQLETSVPEEAFEEHIARVKGKKRELTSVGVLRIATAIKRDKIRKENEELVNQALPLPSGKYKTILIDPPWDWEDEADVDQFGRASPLYVTTPFEELLELPLDELADEDSHLYLWITNRSLPKGFELLRAWGFRYITLLTWCKPSFGMGNYFRGQTEHIIFGVKGSCPLLRHDIGTWFLANRGNGHSSKPERIYEIIETCSPSPWLELFARNKREGWYSWGAEIGAEA